MAIKLEIHNRGLATRLESLQDWNIPATEKKALLRFLDELALGRVNKGQKISESRQVKYLDVLRAPLEFLQLSTEKLTIKHIERFEKELSSGLLKSSRGSPYSHATKVDMRRALQVYLRWRLGQQRADKLTDWFDTRDIFKTPDFISEHDMRRLYKACKCTRERYLIAVLFDSGARASEFHNIRFEDVQLAEGEKNYCRIALKEEYSKTKGRTVSLYWQHSQEAVKDYLAERLGEGMKSADPVYAASYDATRVFLRRLGKKVLGRLIHYHLFRHSSATYYASRMNRQQLCIRYGWTFSSHMPDVYIARSGVELEELDEKFTATTVEKLQEELAGEKEKNASKEERIQRLEAAMEVIGREFQALAKAYALKPSIAQVEAELKHRLKRRTDSYADKVS